MCRVRREGSYAGAGAEEALEEGEAEEATAEAMVEATAEAAAKAEVAAAAAESNAVRQYPIGRRPEHLRRHQRVRGAAGLQREPVESQAGGESAGRGERLLRFGVRCRRRFEVCLGGA